MGRRKSYFEIDPALAQAFEELIDRKIATLIEAKRAVTDKHALKALPWFSTCVRDIRAFKVYHENDFTYFIKTCNMFYENILHVSKTHDRHSYCHWMARS